MLTGGQLALCLLDDQVGGVGAQRPGDREGGSPQPAEQRVHGHAQPLADRVPQRHLEAGLGGRVAGDELVHPGGELADVAGVGVDQVRRQVVVDEHLDAFDGFAAPPRAAGDDGLADAPHAVAGVQSDDDEALLVHRRGGEPVRAQQWNVDDGGFDGLDQQLCHGCVFL